MSAHEHTSGAGRSRRFGGAAAALRAAGSALRELPPLRGFLPLFAGLAIWELVMHGEQSGFYPPPSQWATDLWHGYRGVLLDHLATTLRTLLLGLGIATAVGVGLGLLIGVSPPVRRTLAPTLEFLRSLPAPTVIPVAVLALGQTDTMRVAVVALASVWPVLLNTTSAAANTDPQLLEVARSFRLGRLARARKVIFPAAVPAAMTGIRVALPIALILTILVEMLATGSGIGSDLVFAQRNYQAAVAFGLVVVMGVVGYLLSSAFLVLEGVVLRRWPPRQAGRAGRRRRGWR
jgi:ABC-type nitrate/sulfonate/bicarbonate transport system permease component